MTQGLQLKKLLYPVSAVDTDTTADDAVDTEGEGFTINKASGKDPEFSATATKGTGA